MDVIARKQFVRDVRRLYPRQAAAALIAYEDACERVEYHRALTQRAEINLEWARNRANRILWKCRERAMQREK